MNPGLWFAPMELTLAPKCIHNDCGNCPGVSSCRKSSKSLRRCLCVVPDDVSDLPAARVLPEASLLPKVVGNKSAGLGRHLDNLILDAAACRKGNPTRLVLLADGPLHVHSIRHCRTACSCFLEVPLFRRAAIGMRVQRIGENTLAAMISKTSGTERALPA